MAVSPTSILFFVFPLLFFWSCTNITWYDGQELEINLECWVLWVPTYLRAISSINLWGISTYSLSKNIPTQPAGPALSTTSTRWSPLHPLSIFIYHFHLPIHYSHTHLALLMATVTSLPQYWRNIVTGTDRTHVWGGLSPPLCRSVHMAFVVQDGRDVWVVPASPLY